MAVILVDYENVWGKNGLKGVEYLTNKDTLYLFYSQCCGKVKAEYMEQIERSGCDFKIFKLVKIGKNALDFYIAAECGIQCEKGEEKIAIVSGDKGFEAVTDYFKSREENSNRVVVIAPTVENGIMAINAADDVERLQLMRSRTQMLDIGQEYARLEERKAYQKKLVNALKGTEYEVLTGEVVALMEENKELPKREVYTGTLHSFGRVRGTAIYRLLRDVV